MLKRNKLLKKESVQAKNKEHEREIYNNIRGSPNAKKQVEILKLQRKNKEKKLIKIFKKLKVKELKKIRKYSQFLAKDILVTQSFVNRIQKESGKKVVVIANKSTGKPYVWGLKNSEKIKVDEVKYPSTGPGLSLEGKQTLAKFKQNLINKVKEHKSKDTIIMIVDSSKAPRMPGSFVGADKISMSISSKDSIVNVLKKEKPQLVGYKRSLKENEKDKLPHYKDIKSDFILFNPVKEKEKIVKNKNRFISAADRYYTVYHDNNKILQSNTFKEMTLNYVNMFKDSYFGKR